MVSPNGQSPLMITPATEIGLRLTMPQVMTIHNLMRAAAPQMTDAAQMRVIADIMAALEEGMNRAQTEAQVQAELEPARFWEE